MFFPGPPRAGAAIMRTDRLYDLHRLRRAVRSGGDLESAVIWRLDRAKVAVDRRGRVEAAADVSAPRAVLGILSGRGAGRDARGHRRASQPPDTRRRRSDALASAIVAFGGPGYVPSTATALALAAALVLDTADGRLARLQGTSSAFGRWLDHVLDELADVALHAAIAWSVFQSSRQPYWLVIGMLYLGGKYVFMIESLTGLELEAERKHGGQDEDRGRSGSRAGNRTRPTETPPCRAVRGGQGAKEDRRCRGSCRPALASLDRARVTRPA